MLILHWYVRDTYDENILKMDLQEKKDTLKRWRHRLARDKSQLENIEKALKGKKPKLKTKFEVRIISINGLASDRFLIESI